MGDAAAIVLFDIDGTLLRGVGPCHKEALIEGIRQVTGITTSFDGVATAGTLDRDLIASLLATGGYSDDRIRAALPEIAEACEAVYLRNCASDLRPFVCPGVRRFLEQLRTHDAALGLVTGNLNAIGWKKMELAGLRNYFSVGAFSQDGHTRTELAGIAAERARAHCQWARQCPVTLIGDHANDILAAKANGFRSVAVATGVSAKEELQRFLPDIVARTLAEFNPAEIIAPYERCQERRTGIKCTSAHHVDMGIE